MRFGCIPHPPSVRVHPVPCRAVVIWVLFLPSSIHTHLPLWPWRCCLFRGNDWSYQRWSRSGQHLLCGPSHIPTARRKQRVVCLIGCGDVWCGWGWCAVGDVIEHAPIVFPSRWLTPRWRLIVVTNHNPSPNPSHDLFHIFLIPTMPAHTSITLMQPLLYDPFFCDNTITPFW